MQVERGEMDIAVKLEWSRQTLGTSLFKRCLGHSWEESNSIFFPFLLQNGSRRRTPGGVFLNLLKNTPSISEEQIKVKMTFKIHDNLTSTQPLASFSTHLHHLLCLKLTNFVVSCQVKFMLFVKLCLFFFPFRAKMHSLFHSFLCLLYFS